MASTSRAPQTIPTEPHETMSRAALEALARNVSTRRVARQWNQTDLAQAAGMTQQRISSLEAALGNMTIETIARVAKALETSVGALLSE